MVRVTVLYFAAVKELAGCAREELEAESLYALLDAVCERHPQLTSLVASMKLGQSSTVLAVNQVFTPVLSDRALSNDSEVAFIAPISDPNGLILRVTKMRATDLSFRSPKERTPDAYFPQITADGRVLAFSPRQTRGGVIGNELRFREYMQHFRKTGFRVGPGSYDTDQETISRSPIKGSFIYKPLHKDTSHNGYIMVGNHMVYEGHLVSPGRRRDLKVKDPDCRVDAEFALSQTAADTGSFRNPSNLSSRPRTEGPEDPRHHDRHRPMFRSLKSVTRRSLTLNKSKDGKKPPMTLSVKEKKIRKMLDDRLSVPL